MKVMVLGKATNGSEAGEFGSVEEFAVMGEFNQRLIEAGVLVAGDSIWPVASMDEAVEWAKRSPVRTREIELRKILDSDDFDESFAAEIAAAEGR